MTNKPMLSERDKFEAFWRKEMNIEAMDLHRCEFPMIAYDDQPYACHETERGRLTWMARAGFGHQVNQPSDPVAVFEIDASGYRARLVLDPAKPFPSSGTKLYAEQLAPVLRCSFCDVTDNAGNPWSGHHESVGGKLIYRVMGCKDHKHLVDALDGSKSTPVEDHTQCEECKGWGYHENHHEGGGTECGECGGSGNATVAEVMVMPDRMKVEPFTTIDRGSKNYKAGYNAAISDAIKLNGLKP